MTQYIERGPIPREPRRILMSDDSRPDPAAAVDAIERRLGLPVQVAYAADVRRISGDYLDEPPD